MFLHKFCLKDVFKKNFFLLLFVTLYNDSQSFDTSFYNTVFSLQTPTFTQDFNVSVFTRRGTPRSVIPFLQNVTKPHFNLYIFSPNLTHFDNIYPKTFLVPRYTLFRSSLSTSSSTISCSFERVPFPILTRVSLPSFRYFQRRSTCRSFSRFYSSTCRFRTFVIPHSFVVLLIVVLTPS